MAHNILIIQGHPDPAGGHLCHALAKAYFQGAIQAGHRVETLDLSQIDIPFLRSQDDFEHGIVPASLHRASEMMLNATHYVIVFPLWLGTMPALLKAFLEQIVRPNVAFTYQDKGLSAQSLKGRSARIIVTMGMPAFVYRGFYLSHGVKVLERNILKFVGITPVRTKYFGMVDKASHARRAKWLAEMEHAGQRAE